MVWQVRVGRSEVGWRGGFVQVMCVGLGGMGFDRRGGLG